MARINTQERLQLGITLGQSARLIASAAFTLFATPNHKTLHITMEERHKGGQPLSVGIATTVEQIKTVIAAECPHLGDRSYSLRQIGATAGLLMQFSDHIGDIPDDVKVNNELIEHMRRELVDGAQKKGAPLSHAEQLLVALRLNNNDLLDGMYALVLGSRQHARWLDSEATGTPDMDDADKLNKMSAWRTAIEGLKATSPQDPTGDNYYTWTHAYAQVLFRLSSDKCKHLMAGGSRLFRNGTKIMHTVVHSVNKQGVPSNHTLAADYGNAIGDAVVEHYA